MTDATLKLIISLRDEASKGLKSIQASLGGLVEQAQAAASGVKDFLGGALQFAAGGLIQKGIEGIAGAIGNLKSGLIDGNAEFERYQVQFKVLLGSAEAAKQRLSDLAKFGASTPFELPEVVRADKILQSFGLHAQDAARRFGYAGVEIRTIAGDVAAGTGASFEEISGYIGKFASGATGETIARFQELGIVTKQQLTQMGLAFDKGSSLIINSQADLDRATGILLKSMQQKYGGMMDAQSNTFEGMISNLQDWKAQTLRTLGAPLFDVLRGQLKGLLAWLPSIQPQIEAFAQSLAGGLQQAIVVASRAGSALLGVGRAVMGLARFFQGGAKDQSVWLAAWNNLTNVIGPRATNIIFSLVAAVGRLGQAFQQGGFRGAFAALPATLSTLGGRLKDALGFIPGMLLQLGKTWAIALWQWVQDAAPIGFTKLETWGAGVLAWAMAWLPKLRAQAITWASALWDWITTSGPTTLANLESWVTGLLAWVSTQKDRLATQLGVWGEALWSWLKDAAASGQLEAWFGQIVTWVQSKIPDLINGFLGWRVGLLQWLLDATPGAITALGDMVGKLVDFAQTLLPVIWEAIKPWGEALWQSFTTNGPKILESLGQVLGQLIGWVQTNLPLWIAQFTPYAAALWEWIGTAWDGMQSNLATMLRNLISWVLAQLPVWGASLKSWAGALWQWIVDAAPGAMQALSNMIDGIWAWIAEQGPILAAQLGVWAIAMIGWISEAIPKLIIAAGELSAALFTWIAQRAPGLRAQLSEWNNQFGIWARDEALPALIKALLGIANGLWEGIKTKWNAAFAEGSLGASIIDGIKASLLASWESFKAWFWDLFLNAIPGAKALAKATGIGGGSSTPPVPDPTLPGFANGVRNFSGGLALVGERGPEILNLPRGSDVLPMSVGGSSISIGNITLQVSEAIPDAKTLVKAVIEPLRDELTRLAKRNMTSGII